MTREEVNGLDERIKELKLQHQEAERINLKNKAGELLVDINYLEELRELRNKQEPCEDCISRKSVEELISNNNDKYGYSDRFHEFTEECMNLPPVQQEEYGKMKAFCLWIAEIVTDEEAWKDSEAIAEIACRKLHKLGIVDKQGDSWVYKE